MTLYCLLQGIFIAKHGTYGPDTKESYWFYKAAPKLFDNRKLTGKKAIKDRKKEIKSVDRKKVCRKKYVPKIYLAKFLTTTCIISHTPLNIFVATLMWAQKSS